MAGPRARKIIEVWRGLFGPSSAKSSPVEGVKDAATEAKAGIGEALHREGDSSPTPFAGASSTLSQAATTARERSGKAAGEIKTRIHDLRERRGEATANSDGGGDATGPAITGTVRAVAANAAELARKVASEAGHRVHSSGDSPTRADAVTATPDAEASTVDEALSGTGGSSWSASESGSGPSTEFPPDKSDPLPDAEGELADLDKAAEIVPPTSDDADALVSTDEDADEVLDREIETADDWSSSEATAAYVENLADDRASATDEPLSDIEMLTDDLSAAPNETPAPEDMAVIDVDVETLPDASTASAADWSDADVTTAYIADAVGGGTTETSGEPGVIGGSVPGDGTTQTPPGYPIKGNGNSKIYHMPGQSSYDATIPEMCFATEADAVAAGFRARKR